MARTHLIILINSLVCVTQALPVHIADQQFINSVSERMGIDGRNIGISTNDVSVPAHMRLKYWSLAMKHKRLSREKRSRFNLPTFAKVIRENEAFLSDVLYAGTMRHQLRFDMVGKIDRDSRVTIAELKLYKERPNFTMHKHLQNGTSQSHSHHARVSIHHVIKSPDNSSDTANIIVDSRLVELNDSGWKTFDVTSAVKRWSQDPGEEFLLELWIEGDRATSHAIKVAKNVEFVTEQTNVEQKPRLVVYTEHYEQRFDPTDCGEGTASETCCRRPKYISFRNMEWTNRWIIEPRGYEAYECVGPCHIRHSSQATDLINCGVSKSSPLPMMYLIQKGDITQVEVSEIPNMVVEECECLA
uniref:Left-right determination factor n=1 Tax=Saccoglossus kowalevskii TaxID=10224 RepID=A0A0U2USL1_SACKO|nr:left-right determination factor precursor [Saccoglossus kowalevskii]